MEGGEKRLMSVEWADAGEGMVHPTDKVLEDEVSTSLHQEQRKDARRWPELASEVQDAVRLFETEHDARTLRMYMADWADHLIGKVLGVDEVPWFLLGVPQHPHFEPICSNLTATSCLPGLSCPMPLCDKRLNHSVRDLE